MRIRSLSVMLLAGAMAAGCNSDCPTPTSPTSPGTGLSIASLSISGPSELQVGQTAQLTATARFSDGTTQVVTTAVTWVTNNVNICTVNAEGVLTAVSNGTCNITAVINNINGTHTVVCFTPGNPTANPPTGPTTPTGIGLTIEGPSSVAVGGQIQLRAFITNGHQEVTNQAAWSGNNPGVATTSNDGRVNGQSVGSVDVTATYQGNGGTKNVQVTTDGNPPANPPICPGGPGCPPGDPPVCTNPPCGPTQPTVTSLSIQGVTSVPVGQTSQLTAIASLSNGTSQNVTGSSSWSSGDGGIAPVNGTGLVTGAAQGTTPISATYGGASASVNFTVTTGGGPTTPTVNSLAVTGLTPMTVGQSSQYNAVANLSDGTNPNVNGSAQWSSSNPGVATVGSSGNVTAVSAGTTVIQATHQGRSGSVPLTVNAATPDLIGLELRIGANVLTGNGPLGLNLNLSDLINGNPIIDLKVFALYSDGSKRDVTSASVINSPLLAIDGQGVGQLVALLIAGTLNPNHQINVTYGGFTANVNVTIALPVLQSLGFPSNTISLSNHNQLPALATLFSQGITSTVDASLPGLSYATQPGGALGSVLGLPVVGPLVQQLLNTVQVVNGVVNVDNTLLGNPLVQAALAPLGGLPIDLRATLNGVTSAPVTLLIH